MTLMRLWEGRVVNGEKEQNIEQLVKYRALGMVV